MCLLVSFIDYAVEERPSQISVMQQLEDGGPDPLVFVLNANLLSMVKIVNCKFLLLNKAWGVRGEMLSILVGITTFLFGRIVSENVHGLKTLYLAILS